MESTGVDLDTPAGEIRWAGLTWRTFKSGIMESQPVSELECVQQFPRVFRRTGPDRYHAAWLDPSLGRERVMYVYMAAGRWVAFPQDEDKMDFEQHAICHAEPLLRREGFQYLQDTLRAIRNHCIGHEYYESMAEAETRSEIAWIYNENRFHRTLMDAVLQAIDDALYSREARARYQNLPAMIPGQTHRDTCLESPWQSDEVVQIPIGAQSGTAPAYIVDMGFKLPSSPDKKSLGAITLSPKTASIEIQSFHPDSECVAISVCPLNIEDTERLIPAMTARAMSSLVGMLADQTDTLRAYGEAMAGVIRQVYGQEKTSIYQRWIEEQIAATRKSAADRLADLSVELGIPWQAKPFGAATMPERDMRDDYHVNPVP